MKCLFLAVLALSVLAGCSSRQPMTEAQQQAFLQQQEAIHNADATTPAERDARIEQLKAEQASKAQQKAENERAEKLCESLHPYSASQCYLNESVGNVVNAL